MISQEEKSKVIADYFKSIMPEWMRNVDSCMVCRCLAENIINIDAKLTHTSVEESDKAGSIIFSIITHFKKEHGKK